MEEKSGGSTQSGEAMSRFREPWITALWMTLLDRKKSSLGVMARMLTLSWKNWIEFLPMWSGRTCLRTLGSSILTGWVLTIRPLSLFLVRSGPLWRKEENSVWNNPSKLKVKTKECKEELRRWTHEMRKQMNSSIVETNQRINDLSLSMDPSNWQRLKREEKYLNCLLEKKEVYWRQRSRAVWLKCGDRNSRYFHHKDSLRKKKNNIGGLFNNKGTFQSEVENIEKTFVDYFQTLFRSTSPSNEIIDSAIRGIQPKITEAMNESLLGMFTEEDVFSAVRGMNPIKAPGIDGLPALFFQKFWSSIRCDVVSVCLKVLNENNPLHQLNETLIMLIPKVPKAKKVEEYRPISLCNVVYKIVSKCLVERMKSSLTVAVSNSQSAFVTGRMIHDNAIIGYEGLHCMRKDCFGNGKKMALKLDMSKAYDRIEWRFVERLMLKMGYHEVWVKKIMGCITSVSFSFLLNKEVRGNVSPERGLRQGDPLSPFIFVLCAEALSCLILGAEQRNLLEGLCFGRKGVRVSHLFFADDSIMFLNVDTDECRALKDILLCYTTASGQMINFSKSEVCFGSKVDDGAKKEIADIFEVKITDHFESIHSIAAKFWWGSSEKRRRIHWCKWEVLCKRKFRGGLGFKDMELFNKAMLAKQCWRLERSPDSLVAKVLKYSYHSNCEFLHAKMGSAPSFIWRSLLWGRQIIEAGARWRIGSGEEVRIVEDKWLPRPVQFTFLEKLELPPGLKVIDLRGAEGDWDENFVRNIFTKEDANNIMSIIPGPLDSRDKRIWHFNQNGEYSVRSGYQVAIRERERCWNSRNNAFFKKWNLEATAVVDWATNYHNEFVQSRVATSYKTNSTHKAWTAPAMGDLMINVDAAANKGIKLCKRLNLKGGLIVSDCSLAVGMLNRPPEESGDLDLLVADIKREAEDHRILSVWFGPRSSNVVAHLIAKFAIRYQASGFWEGGVPPMASLALAEDMALLGV
ncbi:uncharacterized protein LOC133800152 [Humulus lupulus]|uniref:uncharacterized protein LOC133800152 n=1 Tax=Humulus lupulus TaxID=3486 RepID=UPI002B40B2F5|nr:uncharacterized protein LOC133800152 [Humulus lupulus]